jgi:hypothetical protein
MKKLIFALVTYVALTAFAQHKQDGNELLVHINEETSFSYAVALGYIRGVSDSMACIPSQVNNGQLVDIVKKYLEQNPESRHEYRGVLVIRALSKAYPCKKK